MEVLNSTKSRTGSSASPYIPLTSETLMVTFGWRYCDLSDFNSLVPPRLLSPQWKPLNLSWISSPIAGFEPIASEEGNFSSIQSTQIESQPCYYSNSDNWLLGKVLRTRLLPCSWNQALVDPLDVVNCVPCSFPLCLGLCPDETATFALWIPEYLPEWVSLPISVVGPGPTDHPSHPSWTSPLLKGMSSSSFQIGFNKL